MFFSMVRRQAVALKKFVPVSDRVVIERVALGIKTKDGIMIPEKTQGKVLEGTVVAVGPGRRNEEGKTVPTQLKASDRVLLPGYQAAVGINFFVDIRFLYSSNAAVGFSFKRKFYSIISTKELLEEKEKYEKKLLEGKEKYEKKLLEEKEKYEKKLTEIGALEEKVKTKTSEVLLLRGKLDPRGIIDEIELRVILHKINLAPEYKESPISFFADQRKTRKELFKELFRHPGFAATREKFNEDEDFARLTDEEFGKIVAWVYENRSKAIHKVDLKSVTIPKKFDKKTKSVVKALCSFADANWEYEH
ncbi:chaperonin 10 kd subunit domain-containing protein [Ditylenchus destructor]|nr:chaperonin 10 kd subunit domain-containing protein [Ditylenchus destructor]